MDLWDFLKVVQVLRLTRVPISTQDVVDALFSIIHFRQLPPRIVLRTLLVHRPEDMVIFDRVWQILFKFPAPDSSVKRLGSSCPGGGIGSGKGQGGITISAQDTLPIIANYLAQVPGVPDFASLDDLPVELVQAVLAGTNYYTWINNVDLAYQRGELGWDEWQSTQDYARQIRTAAEEVLIFTQVEQANDWLPLYKQSWRFKPLHSLSAEERALMQAAIRHWGRKLAVRPGSRWKTGRGTLNPAKTIKSAWRGAGKVFYFFYHHRLPRNPELVVLCDVSNSVAPYAEFLLYLVQSLRCRFRRVHLFFFVDTLWDVPDKFWEQDIDDWKEDILSWGRKTSSGYSDYGKVFRELASYLPNVSKKATMLLLGDGKNNFRSPCPEYLEQAKLHVRRIIWLNPLRSEEWEERDNALPFYRAHCTHVLCCRTAEDLYELARVLT